MATVGVNLLWLVPGVVGGSEEYTLRLLRALDQLEDDDIWIRLYGHQRLFDAHPDLTGRFEVSVAPAPISSKAARIAAENTWLATASRHDDIVHHGGGVVPTVRSRPAVVTVHDLQPFDRPEHFSAVKRRWLAATVPPSVSAARLVLCPSRFTADRLEDRFGVAPAKLRVVPHGHEACEVGVLDDTLHETLRRRYGRYALLPAVAYPHKRHADLVLALAELRDRFPDLSVVMTGRADSETEPVRRLAAELGLGDRVHQVGRVSERELDGLFRSAVAMVFPSEYEGFGNPVLEAMARGCPVVTTDAGALPEVAGSAALIVPVGRPRALAAGLARVLDEPELVDDLRARGLVQAKQFSWLGAGRRLAACYREALEPAGLAAAGAS